MTSKFFTVKDFIGEALWWDNKIRYFRSLWRELFACWLYISVYPKHGTSEVSFPPWIGKEPIYVTKPEDLSRPDKALAGGKIIPWRAVDIISSSDQLKNTEEMMAFNHNDCFIDEAVFVLLRNNSEYIVDSKFIKVLSKSIYAAYPFGFDLRISESFLHLSDVSYGMSILYGILSRIKIENITNADIDGCKHTVAYAETCLSHELIISSNLLIGYWTKKIEEKRQRRGSGKGQQEAEQSRQAKLGEKIKEKSGGNIPDNLFLDKGSFVKMLNEVWQSDYPKHQRTIKNYKEAVEKAYRIKIKWKRGAFL